MTTITRRGALGVAASLLAMPALAQGRFPNRPIRFLIPWPPGGCSMRCIGRCSRSSTRTSASRC